MTREEEHQRMNDAFKKHHDELIGNPEAIKKLLIELGIWHLLVPKKSKKKSAKR